METGITNEKRGEMEPFQHEGPIKITVLSPHIDDAAYGLALTISECVKSKIDLTILNCFTYTKWAIRFVSKDLNEISLLRKNEDASFYKQFDFPIKIVNLEMVDAPLRNNYIFKSKALAEDEWLIVDQLKKYLETLHGILLCPLAIGDHIDHVICVEAAIQLYDKLNIVFFEDLPYAARIMEDQIHAHVQNLEQRLKVRFTNHIGDLKSCTIDKEKSVNLYKTQINDEICAEIIAHLNRLSGERLWGEPHLIQALKKCFVCK